MPGPGYSADDATTLHTSSPADPREILTGAGFAIPGAAMTWKLHVRLHTGNEARSEALTVTRPVWQTRPPAGVISARAPRPRRRDRTPPDIPTRHPEIPCQTKDC